MTRRSRTWLLRSLDVPIRMGRPSRLTPAQKKAIPVMLETMTQKDVAALLGVKINVVHYVANRQ